MCGRYALGLRATFIRHRIRDNGMPAEDAPDDDDVRETYNFAPGNIGIVYRADTPPSGAGGGHRAQDGNVHDGAEEGDAPTEDDAVSNSHEADVKGDAATNDQPEAVKYKLQAMKWGLVPFWTKRDPGYGGLMKTINARDDSLAASGGMWNTMKKTKRCIVLAQGFYEWLKKDGGKTKIPHFVKRKDGELMCFAGLWDCVQYEGRDEQLWTYTIITTDSNKQLSFLHDRMPVILDNGSADLRTWLDPERTEWTRELQSLLKPYQGELEFYPVNKDVGKVGNNSPDFIVPIDSSENKSNIANFFGNARTKQALSNGNVPSSRPVASVDEEKKTVKEEERETIDVPRSEDNAPMPVSESTAPAKRKLELEEVQKPEKQIKLEDSAEKSISSAKQTPSKTPVGKKTKSATSNGTALKPEKAKTSASGSQKITSFFGK